MEPARDPFSACANALTAFVRNINIDGVPTGNARRQKLPYNLQELKPGVFITLVPERFEGRGNASDWWMVRCQLSYFEASNGNVDDETAQAKWTYARTRFIESLTPSNERAILGGSLIGVASTLTIIPGPLYDPEAFSQGYDAQMLICEFGCVRNRVRTDGL